MRTRLEPAARSMARTRGADGAREVGSPNFVRIRERPDPAKNWFADESRCKCEHHSQRFALFGHTNLGTQSSEEDRMGRALPGVADVCTAICCDGPEEMPALHLEVKESTNECLEALDYRAPGFKVTICLYASWVHAGVHHEERTDATYGNCARDWGSETFQLPVSRLQERSV